MVVNILLVGCELIALLYIVSLIIALVITVYKKIKFGTPFSEFQFNLFGKDNNANKAGITLVLIAISIIGLAALIVPNTAFGVEEIGAILEKNDYTAYYYVSMFPEDSESKNYKVVAEIWATDKNYIIRKAYFPNEGYLTFDGYVFGLPDDSLKFDEMIYIYDDNDDYWNIQLLDERPSNYKLKEIGVEF